MSFYSGPPMHFTPALTAVLLAEQNSTWALILASRALVIELG
jgi:ABC-type branched-subunit amino acid transport system ATPase component